MSDIKLKAASGGGSISIKGPSSLDTDRDLVDTSGNINLLDSQKLNVGTGNDLKIRHDGTNNHIEGLNGSTYIGAVEYVNIRSTDSNGSNAKWMIRCHNDAEVSLYHNNTLQCETSANGLAFPSGKGIDFSAVSHAGGMTSELLDTYEEGTWTPADASGQSISYTDTAGNCTYTKIGRTVIANFGVTFLSTSNAHEAKIGGLPFTCINTTSSNAAVAVSEHTDDQSTTMIVIENQSYIVILHCHNGVDARTNAECSGKNYRGTVVYQTD